MLSSLVLLVVWVVGLIATYVLIRTAVHHGIRDADRSRAREAGAAATRQRYAERAQPPGL